MLERRNVRRRRVCLEALLTDDDRPCPQRRGRLHDLSAGGAQMVMDGDGDGGETALRLIVPRTQASRSVEVVWRRGLRIGVAFRDHRGTGVLPAIGALDGPGPQAIARLVGFRLDDIAAKAGRRA